MEEEESDSQGELVVVTDRKTPFHPKLTHAMNVTSSAPQTLAYAPSTNLLLTGNTPPSLCHGDAQLALEEKKFLLAVERGDLATVRRTLERKLKDPTYININCVDPLGRSALLMAIDNENLEMVELLIEHKVETKDALLHAIHEQYVEAVEVLLDHEAVIHRPNTPHSWEALDPDAATFTPDITPLILAAHKDNYEIIKILLDRGATLPMPHDVRCGCEECVTSRLEDSLRHSRSRINAYRALASPSLIALSSKDPILTAFELSWELKRLSFLEHEFKNEYQELRKQCQNFATALLDHTRSSYELEVMLNHDPTGPAFEHGERMSLNRLKLAIKYKQKKFVSHPNVQQLLASIWYEGLPGFRRKNVVFQTLQIVWIGFLFPLYSIVYILLPHTTLGQTMRKPFIKFIGHSASYITFLILLILAAQRIETVISNLLGHDDTPITAWSHYVHEPVTDATTLINSTRHPPSSKLYKNETTTNKGSPPTIVECLILAWVMGLIWAEIKQLWEDGLIEYIGDMWNIIDFITNSLYVATIALRAVSYYQVQNKLALDPNTPQQERKDWEDWDPMLISEGLFSAANIFSSLKLVYIFSVNPHLGPLQISLGRMVIDILKFFFVYSLVLFAFACGMNQLLWYYADSEKRLCPTDDDVPKTEPCYRWRRFSNLFESSQTLFWASFGLIDLNNFELAGIKSYTRFWGMLMFGTYSVINVVVLLNLLIAMMNHSYQLISDRTDVEWKFARSKLWISYFEEGGTVPPPFNIIPTPKNLYYIFRWFYRKIYGRSRAAKKEHMRTIRKKARQASERDYRYQSIMRNLVRRYITVEQRKADNQGVTEDDVNEIKQDISSFRYELIEILKNSGMNTACAQEPQGPGGKKCRLKERRLMKGFNIGRAESFPLTETVSDPIPTLATSASLPSPLRLTGAIKSPPVGKLKRAAKEAGTKHSYHRRWGQLVDAAKHSLGRSSSQDSFGSQSSVERVSQQGASSNGDSSTLSYPDTFHHNPIPGGGGGQTDNPSRMQALRSRLTSFPYFPAKFKVPSFEDSRNNAKVRRHIYGGKIHTGSLKSFVKRTASPMFASQRIGSKMQSAAPGVGGAHLQPAPPGDAVLTPIPSQPSSSTRSSPEVTPPSSPPAPLATLVVTARSPLLRTPSPKLMVAPPAMVSSPESGTLTASCSQEPLVGRRGSSPKPSNGSALIQKLPGVQPIGKTTPSGWL